MNAITILWIWLGFVLLVYIGMAIEAMMFSENFKSWVNEMTKDSPDEEVDE